MAAALCIWALRCYRAGRWVPLAYLGQAAAHLRVAVSQRSACWRRKSSGAASTSSPSDGGSKADGSVAKGSSTDLAGAVDAELGDGSPGASQELERQATALEWAVALAASPTGAELGGCPGAVVCGFLGCDVHAHVRLLSQQCGPDRLPAPLLPLDCITRCPYHPMLTSGVLASARFHVYFPLAAVDQAPGTGGDGERTTSQMLSNRVSFTRIRRLQSLAARRHNTAVHALVDCLRDDARMVMHVALE